MGKSIENRQFTPRDFDQFERCIRDQLDTLRALMKRPGFGEGSRTLGAEVELYLIDEQGQPLLQNERILNALPNAGLSLEINRYNLELNLEPVLASGSPFSLLQTQISARLSQVNSVLSAGEQALPIGVLPTLQPQHFGESCMTQEDRYRVLSRELRALRGESFNIAIEQVDRLQLASDDVTLEGANTSMQLHIRVTPDEFNDWFNAAQLVTPLALGLSANSPLLFGKRLWHETRVPLFRQSIDGRSERECERGIPSRVDFGSGWIREGAYELFAELVNLHRPLLPIMNLEDELSSRAPGLNELRLHSGTVWPWNRAVYDPIDDGHLRIELRALPAGPTAIDMMANAAFIIGATAYYQEYMPEWIHKLPFQTLSSDFYDAAKRGLGADIYWPDERGQAGLTAIPLPELVARLLPSVDKGLSALGVDSAERDLYLSVIEQRIAKRQNGASWMLDRFNELLEGSVPIDQIQRRLLRAYREQSNANLPVADWAATV